MSLRFQLALVLSLMLMATLGGFGFAAHWMVSHNTYTQVENNLAGDAHVVAERLLASADSGQRNDVRYADADYADAASPFESADPNTLTKTPSFADICPVTFTGTTDALQQRLQSAIKIGDAFPVSEAGFDALLRGQSVSEVMPVNEGSLSQAHLIYNKPVFKDNQLVNVAQVAQSVEPIETRLMQLRNWLLLGSGTATLLMFGLTWVVASHRLNPLKRIAQIMRDVPHQPAQRIQLNQPDQPAQRIQTIEPNQFHGELNSLASSLNTMLHELHTAHQHTQAQQDFVADVSHELRAPLTTVRGNLGLLQRNLSDADRQAVLRDAVDEIERMSRLVNQLLLVARAAAPDATTKSFCCEPVPLHPLIEDMGRKAIRLMQGRTFSIHIANTVRANCAALGNSDALKQVLLILLDNAAKFTPQGGQVSLSLSIEGRWARLSVQDNGAGISADELPHVFERGYRGSTPCAGNGLGLSIARQLMEAQGGHITVTSTAGVGSVFSVLLPVT